MLSYASRLLRESRSMHADQFPHRQTPFSPTQECCSSWIQSPVSCRSPTSDVDGSSDQTTASAVGFHTRSVALFSKSCSRCGGV